MSYILIVDDAPHLRFLLKVNLEKRGFDVIEAGSAEAALACIQDRLPRLMLLDLGLPGMDGLALLDLLAQENDLAKFPVIIVSAWGKERIGEISTQYPQVFRVMAKPMSILPLLQIIEEALAGKANE